MVINSSPKLLRHSLIYLIFKITVVLKLILQHFSQLIEESKMTLKANNESISLIKMYVLASNFFRKRQ